MEIGLWFEVSEGSPDLRIGVIEQVFETRGKSPSPKEYWKIK